MGERRPKWFDHLTDEQLQGALYALHLFRTSPRVRGAALEKLDDAIAVCEDVMVNDRKMAVIHAAAPEGEARE